MRARYARARYSPSTSPTTTPLKRRVASKSGRARPLRRARPAPPRFGQGMHPLATLAKASPALRSKRCPRIVGRAAGFRYAPLCGTPRDTLPHFFSATAYRCPEFVRIVGAVRLCYRPFLCVGCRLAPRFCCRSSVARRVGAVAAAPRLTSFGFVCLGLPPAEFVWRRLRPCVLAPAGLLG